MSTWPSSSLTIKKVFGSIVSGTDSFEAKKDAIRTSLDLEADVSYEFNDIPHEVKYKEAMNCVKREEG